MSTAGPNLPGTGADDSAVGTTTWSNPGNITADGDVYATAAGTAGAQTHYLKATGFGFSLPSTATVDGITVTVARKSSQNGSLRYTNDTVVSLVKGGTVAGDNKAATSTKWPTTEADASYGGVADKWGSTWLYSDINASNFGVVLSCKNFGASGATASVDSIKVTVTYTDSAAPTVKQSRSLLGVGW